MMRLPRAALVVGALLLPLAAQAQTLAPPAPVADGESLPALQGPIAVRDLLRLPVRTYGDAPPVAVVDDLLIKADGTLDKLVLSDGSFLRMGLDAKRVAFPYSAATIVPGADGRAAFVRINIAKTYGQVVREFLYALISPTDFAVKALIDAPIATSDQPQAGRLMNLWLSPAGELDRADLDIFVGGRSVSWTVHAPFRSLTLERADPEEPTRVSTSLSLAKLRDLPGEGLPPASMPAPAVQPPSSLSPLAPPSGFGTGAPLAPLPSAGGQY
ncbi:hypothetical protein [Pararhodospirillum photometricum]|uniref:Uncharacterized protein n=1 Tax=Pararhodospirillum photometricum DSM 122 TaxID=1150469 RepID=H6SSD7_PARPM|nr:hypothetical protein [Pararhodospirillum photometricum]CCG07816.1 Putative uncharacterized protein [Pararhodospirillum photometricum DSM 122]